MAMKRFLFWFAVGIGAVSLWNARTARREEARAQEAVLQLERAIRDHRAAAQAPTPRVLRQGNETYVVWTEQDAVERQEAEGLPVPIYPGTRVTEAEIKT